MSITSAYDNGADVCDDCITVVCDDCITEAYDQGAEGYDEQAEVMVIMGSEMADHNCIVYLEPELNARCDCGCNNRGAIGLASR
tara:strand:- start:2284 stop:2535 length:252 start_codon:yes stop_codon:yes gene_type:complete